MMPHYRATMRDGTEARGEYVGAQDGYVYLASGDHVDRIEAAHIVHWAADPT